MITAITIIRLLRYMSKKAGAEGYLSNTNFWTPYADDPVFKAKLETFISAFAKEFDDPAIVDYVDGFGLGIWGAKVWCHV